MSLVLKNLTQKIKETADKINFTKLDYSILDRKMKSLGFSLIGNGLDKVCYVSNCGKYVIKFQIGSNDQVKNEVQRYKKIPDEYKKYYIKPLSYDKKYKWVIVRKAKTYNWGRGELPNNIAKNLVELLKEKLPYHAVGIDDIGYNNIGELDGNPILIDYGY